MAMSLTNKRNTRIIERKVYVSPGYYRVYQYELIHYGSRTCVVDVDARTITIDDCGYDTVTTRGKINAFIAAKTRSNVRLARHKGETMLHRGWNGNKPILQDFDGRDTVAF